MGEMAPNNDNGSHITLNAHVFSPEAIRPTTHEFNAKMIDIMDGAPRWYDVGAEQYRQMRKDGQTALPAAVLEPSAVDIKIPSREPGRDIPCRLFLPKTSSSSSSSSKPKSLIMHIHGGGWVLQDEKSYDPYNQKHADMLDVAVVSVGYRLAPEHPYPQGPEDCYDVAEWLIDNSEKEFGASLGFIEGESAGGQLTMATLLHLLEHDNPKYKQHKLKGVIPHFGAFDNRGTPSSYNYRKNSKTLILDRDLVSRYMAAFCPGMTAEELTHPRISPLFADWYALRGKLPPALFTCGSEDCLLDDTVFMSCKYMMAGAETVVKIIPGGPHAYIAYPPQAGDSGAPEGFTAVEEFVKPKLG